MRSTNRFDNEVKLNMAQKNMNSRLGNIALPKYKQGTLDMENQMSDELLQRGGYAQQNRMIRDKKHAFDMATLYSYQGALVRKWLPPHEEIEPPETEAIVPTAASEKLLPPVRALINPNKLTTDYDNKILSIDYQYNYKPGDIFKWCQTDTYWIIYLQDLQELAYFKGDIRKCSYYVEWLDDDGNKQKTYIAVRGPVETKINFIQKHDISVDTPNYTLNILMPKNKYTMHYFRRYAKFYLRGPEDPDDDVCWRVTATDSISTPGILEVNAIEYFSNEFEDDIENGVVDGLIVKPIDPNEGKEESAVEIKGETFTKPKLNNEYYVNNRESGEWSVIQKGKTPPPVKIIPYRNDAGYPSATVVWTQTYSGQFELVFNGESGQLVKTIVVQSLF